jgi:hypothetical protein
MGKEVWQAKEQGAKERGKLDPLSGWRMFSSMPRLRMKINT